MSATSNATLHAQDTRIPLSITLEFPDHPDERVRRIELALNAGRIYHAMIARRAVREALIEQLVDTGLAAIVPADGGLIGNLMVWENLVLPAGYHNDGARDYAGRAGHAGYAGLEARAAGLFAEFGITGERFAALCTAMPDHLDRFEMRLCAFVRAMLTAPSVMVYDSLFDGLNRDETAKVLAFDRVYHTRLADGTSVHLTADLPTLPDMGAHATFHL